MTLDEIAVYSMPILIQAASHFPYMKAESVPSITPYDSERISHRGNQSAEGFCSNILGLGSMTFCKMHEIDAISRMISTNVSTSTVNAPFF